MQPEDACGEQRHFLVSVKSSRGSSGLTENYGSHSTAATRRKTRRTSQSDKGVPPLNRLRCTWGPDFRRSASLYDSTIASRPHQRIEKEHEGSHLDGNPLGRSYHVHSVHVRGVSALVTGSCLLRAKPHVRICRKAKKKR